MIESVPTNREKVSFICDLDLKEALEDWANEESRSVSNLCELIMRQVVEQREASRSAEKKGGKSET